MNNPVQTLDAVSNVTNEYVYHFVTDKSLDEVEKDYVTEKLCYKLKFPYRILKDSVLVSIEDRSLLCKLLKPMIKEDREGDLFLITRKILFYRNLDEYRLKVMFTE